MPATHPGAKRRYRSRTHASASASRPFPGAPLLLWGNSAPLFSSPFAFVGISFFRIPCLLFFCGMLQTAGSSLRAAVSAGLMRSLSFSSLLTFTVWVQMALSIQKQNGDLCVAVGQPFF